MLPLTHFGLILKCAKINFESQVIIGRLDICESCTWYMQYKIDRGHFAMHFVLHQIWIQMNLPNSDPIKIDTFWLGRFEFQIKICNLSLVLGVRWNSATFKKIWWYNSWHLVKHRSYFDKIPTKPWKIGTIGMSHQMLKSSKHADFC